MARLNFFDSKKIMKFDFIWKNERNERIFYGRIFNIFRGNITPFFIASKKPYKIASQDTLEVRMKTTLKSAGINSIFTPHSTRSASASRAATRISIDTVRVNLNSMNHKRERELAAHLIIHLIGNTQPKLMYQLPLE